jgi:IS5 family transposase
MKPRERRETGEQDLFRARLDQIINMEHGLVKLAQAIAWPQIEARCGDVYRDGPSMPPLADPVDGRAFDPQAYVRSL